MSQPCIQRSAPVSLSFPEKALLIAKSSAVAFPNKLNLFKTVFCCWLLSMIYNFSAAQDSSKILKRDTGMHTQNAISAYPLLNTHKIYDQPLTAKQKKNRVLLVAATNITGYSTILVGLNNAWYTNYPRSKFHFFNDNKEWLQVDKAGHMFGAYIESRTSMELWRWSGIERKKRIWFGGLSGILYQTIIETLDGLSTEWGWSWGDMGANTLGSGILIAQELAWDDQRVKVKFSFHKNDYGTTELNNRADKIYGRTLSERLIKDYNALTLWTSVNLYSFMPKSNLPPWLSIAVGYGAEGMFGARDNTARDVNGNITFDHREIKRYRQWYLAPDVDFTKIKTNKKGVKVLLTLLSAFKMPAPSLEFSNGKFKLKALVF
ncbi:MAG: hypothetical protein ABIN94_11050 [Ferruginibacter sp.]